MRTKPINVLVVEDSPVVQVLLVHLLESAPHLRVCGAASSGEAALAFLAKNLPDVILMDVHLQGIDGYETTRRIMETRPLPIVICSASVDPAQVAQTFRSFEAGAVAVVAKPSGPGHPEAAEQAAKLIETVTLMADVKVVRRWPRGRATAPAAPLRAATLERNGEAGAPRVVAVGTSTGGPPVLQTILSALPADFPVPLLIVQHIAPGFLTGLTDWLAQTTGFRVEIATAGTRPQPGTAYLAPDGNHLGLGADGRMFLSQTEPENALRPAVSFLFRSVAAACGSQAAGVLLTGMGRDGAEELAKLRKLGAVTFAQDAASALVNGMPGAAVQLNGATHVLPPTDIAARLVRWAQAFPAPWPQNTVI